MGVGFAGDLAQFRERAVSDPRLSPVVVPIGRGEPRAAKRMTRAVPTIGPTP
jgi:hypothetical protein